MRAPDRAIRALQSRMGCARYGQTCGDGCRRAAVSCCPAVWGERREEPSMIPSRRVWLSTVAAIGFAALVAAPAKLSAQGPVAIDNDDIGGGVPRAPRPPAGRLGVAEGPHPPY